MRSIKRPSSKFHQSNRVRPSSRLRWPKLGWKLKRWQVGLIGVVLAVVGLYWLTRQLILVKRVEVTYANQLWCDDQSQINRWFNTHWLQRSIFGQFQSDAAFSRQFRCVQGVVVSKVAPNGLKVKLTARQPVIVLAKESSQTAQIDLKMLEATAASQTAWLNWGAGNGLPDDHFWVDQTGLIFGRTNMDSNLAIVHWVDSDLDIGKMVSSQELASLLEILAKVGPMQLIRVNEAGNLLLITPDKLRLLFSLNSDVKRQLASLQLIQQKSKIESKVVQIDLRFNKPLVIYQSH